jgi:hypothetical protein
MAVPVRLPDYLFVGRRDDLPPNQTLPGVLFTPFNRICLARHGSESPSNN